MKEVSATPPPPHPMPLNTLCATCILRYLYDVWVFSKLPCITVNCLDDLSLTFNSVDIRKHFSRIESKHVHIKKISHTLIEDVHINSSNSLQAIGTSSHWKLNALSVRMVVSGWVSYDMWTITCSTPVTMSSIPALMCVKQQHNCFVKTSKSTLRTSVHVVSTAVPTARRLVSTKISLESIRWFVPR